MSVTQKMTGSLLCLASVLVVANLAQAQTRPATPAPAAEKQQPMTAEGLFDRWDKDKSKTLSVDEFKAGWQEMQTAMALKKLHDNFVVMDANKNGTLEASEYASLELIKQRGSSAPLMSAFDADKNQRLDFKEYVGMIKTLLSSK